MNFSGGTEAVIPLVYMMGFGTAVSLPSPHTYHEKSAGCPQGLHTVTGQLQASHRSQSPWGFQQVHLTAAGHRKGCWGLRQALKIAPPHYQQEKEQQQHQAIALDTALV